MISPRSFRSERNNRENGDSMNALNVTYLGDGVYCKYEEDMVTLMTNNHETPENTIYLETAVLNSFLKLLKEKGLLNNA